jgi:hypothetical protein
VLLGALGASGALNAQPLVTLDFEDLSPGAYGHPLHPHPYPSAFTTGGVAVYLTDYYFRSCIPGPRQKTCIANCSNNCPWTEGTATAQQNGDIEIALNSVNLEFGITSATMIELGYYAWAGGGVNIEINGDFLAAHHQAGDPVPSSVEKLHHQIVGGYLITVDPIARILSLTPHSQPMIQSFSIGGQELTIDDLHFHNAEIAPLGPSGDSMEPNDSSEMAADLGSAGDLRIPDLSIHAPGDEDFFRVATAAAGVLRAEILFSHRAGDLDLVVYNSRRQEVARSTSVDDNEGVAFEVAGGQAYTIHVYGFDGATNREYELLINGPSGGGNLPPDRFEPNDGPEFGRHLGAAGSIRECNLSIHAPGNNDFFYVTAAGSGAMSVEVLFSHSAGDVDLEVYDPSTQTSVESRSVDDNESVSIQAVQGRDYTILVYGFNGATHPEYELVINGPAGGGSPGRVSFQRGDANADGITNISDAVWILSYLFGGGLAPTCLDAADANDSGVLDVTDGIYLLDSLFQGGRLPPQPFPRCGPDPTPDGLTCLSFAPCP